jgi:hypothetical protein
MHLTDIIHGIIRDHGPIDREQVLVLYRKGVRSGLYEGDPNDRTSVNVALNSLESAKDIYRLYSAGDDRPDSESASPDSDDGLTTRLAALDRAISALPMSITDNVKTHGDKVTALAARFEAFLLGVDSPEEQLKAARQSSGGMIARDSISAAGEPVVLPPMSQAGPPYLYGEPE